MDFKAANRIWQVGGGILSIVILAILIVWWWLNPQLNIFIWLFWLHLPLVMMHEFEEYVYPGGFKEFMNTKTVLSVSTTQSNVPLNEKMIFIINMSAWILIILGAILGKVAPWLGIMMVVFQWINIVGHGILFQIKQGGYNPGLITTIFLFLPYCVGVFWLAIQKELLAPWGFAIAITGGIALALLLPLWSMLNIKKLEQLSK